MKEELRLYIKENYEPVKKQRRLFASYKKLMDDTLFDSEDSEFEQVLENRTSIDDYLLENKNTYSDFQTMLFKMIDERGLKDNDVYNKVHIDRRLFSKIRSDKNYHPSKETILLLGISLELNEEEIEKLLDSASYSLPKNNYYDLIIRFCFLNKIYNLNDINELLDEYNCKLLGY